MTERRLFLHGAGALARKACQCAQGSGWCIVAFVDDAFDGHAPVPDVRVMKPESLGEPGPDDWMFVAIGDSGTRERLMDHYRRLGWPIATLVHPTAVVAPDVTLGEGVVVAAGAIVESATRIGRGAIVDIGVLIDHDCKVADFVHLRAGEVLPPRSVPNGTAKRSAGA